MTFWSRVLVMTIFSLQRQNDTTLVSCLALVRTPTLKGWVFNELVSLRGGSRRRVNEIDDDEDMAIGATGIDFVSVRPPAMSL